MAVFITGDTHGETIDTFQRINCMLNNEREREDGFVASNDTVLVILGDFGGNFGGGQSIEDIEFKEMLEEFGITYFVIRGNHDQRPSNLFDGDTWHFEQMFDGPTYVENRFPHIHYAMDYPWIYNIEGNKTLVLPGAYSVDKGWRIAYEKRYNVPIWFPDEQMTAAEREYTMNLCRLNDFKFDIILSHTAPLSKIPCGSFKFGRDIIDGYKVDTTMEELFDNIYKMCEFKLWAWGHYHESFGRKDLTEDKYYLCLYEKIDNLEKVLYNGPSYRYVERQDIYNEIFKKAEDTNGQ